LGLQTAAVWQFAPLKPALHTQAPFDPQVPFPLHVVDAWQNVLHDDPKKFGAHWLQFGPVKLPLQAQVPVDEQVPLPLHVVAPKQNVQDGKL